MIKRIYIQLILLLSVVNYAAGKLTIDKNLHSVLIGSHISFLEDKTGALTIDDVIDRGDFIPISQSIANFQVSKSTFWLKFTLDNKDNAEDLILEVAQPLLRSINFYYPENGAYNVSQSGMQYPFHQRKYHQSPNFVFDLPLAPGEEKTFYLQLRGDEQVFVPVRVTPAKNFFASVIDTNLTIGIYCGIILVMLFYNIFVYSSTRDRSYLYYVLHTLFVGITQVSLTGFTYKYLWPDSPWFGNYSIFLFTCLVSIVGIQFLIEFLRIKENARKIFFVLKVFQLIYVMYLLTSLAGLYSMTYGLILPTQTVIAVTILTVSVYLYKKGFKEAKYYLIGWSSFMAAIIIYVTKDFGIIPYNNFTSYSLLWGSAAEVTLLSFALADRINIYKEDARKTHEAALAISLENERIIREQNIILEAKVNERTIELKASNEELAKTLKDLQEAESQLVESEKMASLGQLTAGIAHEINNPINFVTSNVSPLRRDIELLINMVNDLEQISTKDAPAEHKKQEIEALKDDMDYDYLKQEIEFLIKGIADGASRTAEIVKGLRVFSRLDEDDLKKADLNEGLDSTLVIVNHLLNNNIKVEKNYSGIALVECFPGKLNQVFLNMMSNAIHAINKRWGDQPHGLLTLSTWNDQDQYYVSIKDNGTGMSEDTKKKIFEPFFTTKEVGEGTGLGMSIAYNTIKKHNGSIQINSVLGEGTEFIIAIPIIHELAKV